MSNLRLYKFLIFSLTIILLSSCAVKNKSSNSNAELRKSNKLYFKKSFQELSKTILNDSLRIDSELKKLKEKVRNYENIHRLKYDDISEWVSINYFLSIAEIEDDFFNTYFPNIEADIYQSNESFITHYGTPKNEIKDSGLTLIDMGIEEETSAPYNPVLEKYKQYFLEYRKKEFENSVILVLSTYSNHYNKNAVKSLNTEDFNFNVIIDWLKRNKKSETIEVLKPAILKKSFLIAHTSMYSSK